MNRLSAARWLTWAALAVALAAVTLTWCYAYDRWSGRALRAPIGYGGDGWGTMAVLKAVATGDAVPFLPKYPASLGAPFRANWNDYPSTEEGLLAGGGFLSWVFGLSAGTNLTLLAAHLLTAASFFFVCRQLRYNVLLSAAGAVIFALSRYSFVRGFQHIGLTLYWHVPLALLVLYWFFHGERFAKDRRKVVFAVAVAVLHGIQNPYYSAIFLQLLAVLTIYHLVARTPRFVVLRLLLVQAVVIGSFLLANVDTLYNRWRNGPNPAAVARAFSDVEMYSLKPLEFFLPLEHHWPWLREWAHRSYYSKSLFLGEPGSPYLGFVGIFALGLLLWSVLKALARRDLTALPAHFWCMLWVIAFAVTGGMNALLGTAGVVLFRSSNRYSIVVLALVLLHLVKRASIAARSWPPVAAPLAAVAVTCFAIWDQLPIHETDAGIANLRNFVATDRRLVGDLEAKLPPGAMLFQLPVMEWPEVPPIGNLHDYEQFRPYLHSRQLRFSYGSQKGRPREAWQSEALQFGVPRFVQLLEKYGFAGILIARPGYGDGAAAMLASLAAAGKSEIVAQSPDFVCVALSPSPTPVMPPEFRGWYGLEGDSEQNWRWSAGESQIVLHHAGAGPRQVEVRFQLESLEPRRVRISRNRVLLREVMLDPAAGGIDVALALALEPGETTLDFSADPPGVRPANGDPRELAFRLGNFDLL